MSSPIRKCTRRYTYDGRTVTYHFWSHGDDIDTVIFLGSGQTGKTPKWVAELGGKGVLVVDGLPHWKAHPSGNDLKKFSAVYTLTAYREVLRTYAKTSLNVIGISQAAPGVVWLAQEAPKSVSNIGLAVPLGLTMHYFGDNPSARLRELKRRVYYGLRQNNVLSALSAREVYVALTLLRTRFSESERGASDNKYAAGLSYDLREDCRQVFQNQRRNGKSLTIFLGQKDTIFPPTEVVESLQQAGLHDIKTVVMPGLSHPSFVSPRDQADLRRIIKAVRTNE